MTNKDSLELSQKQIAAITFFIGNKSVDEACKEAGISRNAYYEWLKEPAFKDELNRLRNEVVEDAIGQLKTNTTKAANTLVSLLDREDHPAVQRAAANDILGHVMKFIELKEMEERLINLENVLESKNK